MSRNMADRLGLGPGVRELKLGSTFTSNKGTAFHTVKFDFKPASVDVSKVATVDVGPNNTMTVTVPHLDGAGIPHTVFKGSQRPYGKECILIIDKITGEITLERAASNIQVKKTRVGPKSSTTQYLTVSGSNSSSNRPITPIEIKQSPTDGRSNSRTKVTSGTNRKPTIQHHPRPQHHSPKRVSPYNQRSPSNIQSKNYSSSPVNQRPTVHASNLSSGSLPMIGLDFDDCHDIPQQSAAPTMPKPSTTVVNERIFMPDPSPTVTTFPTIRDNEVGVLSDSSSTSSSSDSSDSDSELETVPTSTNGNIINGKTSSPLLNLPEDLLNDDLQLSESESD